MHLLAYYLSHTFVNAIKKLFRTWVAIFIAAMVLIGVIFGVVAAVLTETIEDNAGDIPYETTENGEPVVQPDTSEETDTPMTEEDIRMMRQILETVVSVLVIGIILITIYNGDKSGTKIFTMPDVNFLFSAPVKPQSVLMFRVMVQMSAYMLASLYLLFQIPNMVMKFGLDVYTIIAIFIAYMFLLILTELVSTFTYTVIATHEKLRKYILPLVVGILAALAVAVYAVKSVQQLDWMGAVFQVFALPATRWIPVIGWMRGMIMFTSEGNILCGVLCMVLMIAAFILFGWLIGRIKADFYEDALGSAVKRQEMIDQQLAKRNGTGLLNKPHKERKVHTDGFNRGQGAEMFFLHTAYNRKRFSFLGFISKTTVLYLMIGLIAAGITRFLADSRLFLPTALVLLAALFFRNMGNPIESEISCNYLYLVPEKPLNKLFYCLLSGSFETLLDLLPVMLIGYAILLPNPLEAILWLLVMLTFDLFLSVIGLFVTMILPSNLPVMLNSMLNFMLRTGVILPGIVLIIVGMVLKMLPLFLLITVVYHVIGALVLFLICPERLESGRS